MHEKETGKDKIRKICDAIKEQTIVPAKQKANEIIENAKLEAKEIKLRAEADRNELINKTENEILKKQNSSLSSIKSASKQVIDQLKQDIENEFFSKNLLEVVSKASSSPDLIANLITSVIKGIEKEGLDVNLSALIPKSVGADKINLLLASDILNKLKEKKVIEADFSGGAIIKLNDKKITIDISDESLNKLISRYIRKDFRDIIFEKQL